MGVYVLILLLFIAIAFLVTKEGPKSSCQGCLLWLTFAIIWLLVLIVLAFRTLAELKQRASHSENSMGTLHKVEENGKLGVKSKDCE